MQHIAGAFDSASSVSNHILSVECLISRMFPSTSPFYIISLLIALFPGMPLLGSALSHIGRRPD